MRTDSPALNFYAWLRRELAPLPALRSRRKTNDAAWNLQRASRTNDCDPLRSRSEKWTHPVFLLRWALRYTNLRARVCECEVCVHKLWSGHRLQRIVRTRAWCASLRMYVHTHVCAYTHTHTRALGERMKMHRWGPDKPKNADLAPKAGPNGRKRYES